MSLLLGAIFITVSIEIQNTLEENDSFSSKQESTRLLEKHLAENKPETWYDLWNGEFLKMASKNIYETGIKQGEGFDFAYKSTATPPENNTIKIEVLEGVITWTYHTRNEETITEEKVLEIETGKDMKIIALSWYARVKITSNKPIDFPKRYYEVIKKIAHQEVIKTSWYITNN